MLYVTSNNDQCISAEIDMSLDTKKLTLLSLLSLFLLDISQVKLKGWLTRQRVQYEVKSMHTLRAWRSRRVWAVVQVGLIWFTFDDRVSEHESGVRSTLVGLELNDEDGRTAGESFWRGLAAAQRLGQRRVRVSVEQLDAITGAVCRRLDWQSTYVHFEHLPTTHTHTPLSRSAIRSIHLLT